MVLPCLEQTPPPQPGGPGGRTRRYRHSPSPLALAWAVLLCVEGLLCLATPGTLQDPGSNKQESPTKFSDRMLTELSN